VNPLAHIAGIPVEETALSFGPLLLAGASIAALKVRDHLARLRATVASRGETRRSPAR
jgi:hypothetical protein